MIFRLGLFHLHELLHEWDCYLSFFDLKGEWRGYRCSKKKKKKKKQQKNKLGSDLKTNVSGFIRDFFVLKEYIDFRALIRKKVGNYLCERELWYDLLHGKDLDYNVMSQKIVYIVVSGLQLKWGRTKSQPAFPLQRIIYHFRNHFFFKISYFVYIETLFRKFYIVWICQASRIRCDTSSNLGALFDLKINILGRWKFFAINQFQTMQS